MNRIYILLVFFVCSLFGKAQVNYQTGSATYNIPVFSWKDDHSRLFHGFSLNYNSGAGLQTASIASNVGQGWDVTAGGVVLRMQSGEPDDQVPYSENDADLTDDLQKYPAGFLYAKFAAAEGCPERLSRYPLFRGPNHLYKISNALAEDREQDKFTFQVNGHIGTFVLKPNSNEAVLLGESNLKMRFETGTIANCRTNITAFILTDENGLEYRFSAISKSKVLRQGFSDPEGKNLLNQPDFAKGNVYYQSGFDNQPEIINPYVVSAWYLSSITDKLTNRQIVFTYGLNLQTSISSATSIMFENKDNYCILSYNVSKVEEPKLTRVDMPDGHQVNIIYGANRVDVKGDRVISAIDVKYQGVYLSKFVLTTSYFIGKRIGNPQNDYQNSLARLCLKSVQKFSVNLKGEDPPYVFDYYTGAENSVQDNMVPPPFSLNKDIWGFYNGEFSKDRYGTPISPLASVTSLNNDQMVGLCYLRDGSSGLEMNPRENYARNGLLKRVTTPAGGYLEFQYSQNAGKINGTEMMVGGVHVSQTRLSSGPSAFEDCSDNAIITSYAFKEVNNSSSLWGIEKPVNYDGSVPSHYAPEDKYYSWNWRCFPAGCCKYRYQYPGILYREQSVNLPANQKLMNTVMDVLQVISIISTIIDVVNLCLSYGPTILIAVIIDVVLGLVSLIISCAKNYDKDGESQTYYNQNLAAAAPLPVQFRRVEITGSSGEKGRTVMEFTSRNDYNIWDYANVLFGNKQRFAYWAYGLPLLTRVFNAEGNMVKEVQYEYDWDHAKSKVKYKKDIESSEEQLDLVSCKCKVKRNSSFRVTEWENSDLGDRVTTIDNGSDVDAELYNTYTGHVELKSTTTQDLIAGTSNYSITRVYYEYGSNFQPTAITTVLSNGDKKTEHFVYSAQSTEFGNDQGLVLQAMTDNNITDMPIASYTTIRKNENGVLGPDLLLGEKVTEFGQIGSDIKPYRQLEQRFTDPPLFTSSSIYQGQMSASNPSYAETGIMRYDGNGNLISAQDEGKRTISYIYDYDDKFAIATIVGADQSNFKARCAYTSFETEKFGGWELTGLPFYSSSGVTGNQCYVIDQSSLSLKNLSLSGGSELADKYYVTAWANGSLVVTYTNGNGTFTSTPSFTGPVVNGFTYYQFEVPIEGGTDIAVSGSGLVDELRAYPVTARMKTTTYNPVYGKTTDCDENNRITRYEYDNNARLYLVKDDAGNILNMYEYNVAKPVRNVNCSNNDPVYSNGEITVYYEKQGCPKDKKGELVAYTIAEDTYSSTVSQAEVDEMVDYDLLTNGQAYANSHGSCLDWFGNEEGSQNFDKQECDYGYKGSTVSYTVPEDVYFASTQAEANILRDADIYANGQVYANINGVCEVTTDPQWENVDGQVRCSTSQPGHEEILVKDMNPNSSTYNQSPVWIDNGLNSACGATNDPHEVVDIDFTNTTANNATARFVYTDVTPNVTYFFALSASVSSSALLGSIPPGHYDVQVVFPWGTTAGSTVSIYGMLQTSGYSWTNVHVTQSTGTVIQIN